MNTVIKILVILLLIVPTVTYAVNTHSTDLESGSSQDYEVADSVSLSITGDMTIEFWLNFETLTGQHKTVWKEDPTTDASYGINVVNSKLTADFYDVSGNLTRFTIDNNLDGTGTWQQWNIVFDVSVPDIAFYKNGSAVGESSSFTAATSIRDSTSELCIGSENCDATNATFFDGKIDDIRIWDDIRTSQEILDNYNCALVGTEVNLVAYWRFDNNGLDSTSNNNNLTAQNSPTFSTDVPFTDNCGEVPETLIIIISLEVFKVERYFEFIA